MKNILRQYANNKYSQFGEDGIIHRIFEILPKQQEYWCVEFGAWDGKFLSNTYELIANNNWKGLLIEGNAAKIPDLKANYKNNSNAILIHKYVTFEGENTLDNIFKRTDIPVDFDLISIDIDGNDFHVWDSIQNYRPKVVIIEFNPSIPSDIEFVQERNFDISHGNSLLSLINLGKSKGYELIATTDCNGFFVKKEFYDLFGIEDNSIEALWDTQLKTPRIFQMYDGTLVLSEEFKLIWHKKKVGKYELQALPKFLRQFGDSEKASGYFKKLARKVYYKLESYKNRK